MQWVAGLFLVRHRKPRLSAKWLRRMLPALVLMVGCGPSGEYPVRPITLVCPWAVGGGTDRISRQLGLYLEQELGVPVNVVNVTGGGGVTGHRYGARSRPDGYTLTMMTVELNMLHWRNLTHLSWHDFEPVALVNQDAAALFVRGREERWSDLRSLTEHVRRSPRQLTASGTAAGGIWHLALAGWLSTADLAPSDVKWIPMNGAGPSLQELLSGGIDMVCCSLPEARTFLESDQVRCLGVMADRRVPGYAEVPTFQEQGVAWVMGGWRGVGFPQGTPPAVVNRMATAIEKIFAGQTLIEGQRLEDLFARQGFNVSWAGPEPFAALLERSDQSLGSLLTSERFTGVGRSRHLLKPMTFPFLLLTGLLATGLALLAGGLRRRGSVLTGPRPAKNWQPVLETLLLMILFLLLLETAGFVLSAGALIFLMLWRLGVRAPWAGAITAILVPLVYQFFAKGLDVPLPRGWLGW